MEAKTAEGPQTLHERNKTMRSCGGQPIPRPCCNRINRQSEDAVDRGLLLIGGGVGGGTGGGTLPSLRGAGSAIILAGGAHELDRGQDHQHRPKQRHPAAGEERGGADAEHRYYSAAAAII